MSPRTPERAEGRRPRWFAILRAAGLGVLLLIACGASALSQEFKVVVHQQQGVGGLTAVEISRYLLKKETRWPDGTLVRPVVLADDGLQETVCRLLHHKTSSAIHAYWNQMMFSGVDVPPPERRTVAEVLEYVRSTPGAIGLVPPDAPTNGVRVVVLREE